MWECEIFTSTLTHTVQDWYNSGYDFDHALLKSGIVLYTLKY